MGNASNFDLGIFVEQAEYISDEDFSKWTVAHPQEKSIVKKLISSGAKLLSGPRGSGKTTLMLKALHESNNSDVFSVYVNYKTSLKLEPLYKRHANASFWFIQWLIFKIYEGLYEQAGILEKPVSSFYLSKKEEMQRYIRDIENGEIDRIDDIKQKNIDDLHADIDSVLGMLGRVRCVLLLDDAAHAFSKEQQEDFFDFFRKVKSRSISPKAAIYPGVTTFSPSFHVGHDAEEIDVWINPKGENYYKFMRKLLESRLPKDINDRLIGNMPLLKLIIYASNGMPRYMLNMVSLIAVQDDSVDSDFEEYNFKYDRKTVLSSIEKCYQSTRSIYDSLESKLPIYKNFISEGGVFFDNMLKTLKNFNKGESSEKQANIIAIKRPIESEVVKILGFLQYAGLVVPVGDSSRGNKGVYDLYAIHNAAIIVRNVFYSSRSLSPQDYVFAFEEKVGHHYPRVTTQTIFGCVNVSGLFELSLPPCQSCQTARFSEAAKYCTNCGAELKSVSIFENIVNQDINVLPLTDRRVDSIKSSSKIRKIKDILMDHDRRQLRSVPRIGPVWANKISRYAEEQIA